MTQDQKNLFENTVEHLQGELAKLRTGRANPGLIEDLKADYYGTPTTLKQLGNISVPEARQIVVQPWDKAALPFIEKAIRDSDLGLGPVNEGDKLRITIPQLTEERRRELTKVANKIAEEARVKLRNLREELWKEVQKKEENGEISEDEKFRQKEKLQETVDEYNKKIKDIASKKDQEIMQV